MIGDTGAVVELDEFRNELLGAARRAVTSEWVSITDVGRDPNTTFGLVDPPIPPEIQEPGRLQRRRARPA